MIAERLNHLNCHKTRHRTEFFKIRYLAGRFDFFCFIVYISSVMKRQNSFFEIRKIHFWSSNRRCSVKGVLFWRLYFKNICEELLFSFAEFQQRISSLRPEKSLTHTAQKMKFSIKDFLCKCDQILSFLRIWSHSLKKSLMGNFIFWAVRGVFVLIRILTEYCCSRYLYLYCH